MAKDPAILFYTGDFITGTLTMTDEQRGKYILLLCLQHQKGGLTEKDMLNICKTYDEDIFEKFIKNPDGKFYNKRMECEISKRKAYSESRSINRKGKKKTSKTYVKHMEDEDEDRNIIINVNKNEKKICLMENSNVKIEDIKEAFDKTKDLLDADPEYYYNVALDWSKSNNKMRIDWIAAVRNFARKDLKDNKMKLLQKRDGAAEYKKELKLEIERKKNENRKY